jgi:hypothetical protein
MLMIKSKIKLAADERMYHLLEHVEQNQMWFIT